MDQILAWLIKVYGALGSRHPILSLIIVAIISAGLGAVAWQTLGYAWAQQEKQSAPLQPGNHNQNVDINNGIMNQENK